MLHAFYPADRRGELIGKESPRPTSILDGLGGGVGDHGKLGIGKLRALELDLEMVFGRAHER